MKKIISVLLILVFCFTLTPVSANNASTALWVSTGLGVLNFLNNLGNSKKIKKAYEKQAEYYQAATEQIKKKEQNNTLPIKVASEEITISKETVNITFYRAISEFQVVQVDKIDQNGKYLFLSDKPVELKIKFNNKEYRLSVNKKCKISEDSRVFYQGIVNINLPVGKYTLIYSMNDDSDEKTIEVNIPVTQ